MKVYFTQLYVQPSVEFPFSYRFQHYLSTTVTDLVTPSATFREQYGSDSKLVFNISAKRIIQEAEIKGPTVFKKTKDVEYSVFLPFDVIMCNSEVPQSALRYLLHGVCSVFESLGIDPTPIVERQESMIQHICSDPEMFRSSGDNPGWGEKQRRC